MNLAAQADLDVALAGPQLADSQEYLLVHRYDRSREVEDGRIHQEDFCQALGLVPAVKYEREGGPNVADCVNLIRRYFNAPARDVMAFLDALLFNFAIANYDAHSKNYSLLLDGPGSIRLAPLYDLLSTVVFAGTDRKLAMRYGGENRPQYLRGRHLDRLARDLGVKPALVRRRAIAMRERTEAAIEDARRSLPQEFQDQPVLDKVIEVVKQRCEDLSQRAAEVSEPVAVAPAEKSAERVPPLDVGESIGAGFQALGDSLDLAGRLLTEAQEELETLSRESAEAEFSARFDRFLTEFDRAAGEIRRHGREIYDAVVEFDSMVEPTLNLFDDGASERAELQEALARLAGSMGRQLANLQAFYDELSKPDQGSPAFRIPVRNIRAGLRYVLDAKAIISEWEELGPEPRPG